MNDFYVGYLPKAPAGLARFVRKTILVVGLVAVTAALVLVVAQLPFAKSTFEYGKVRTFEGVLVAHPYPTLLVASPEDAMGRREYLPHLLVAPGKHGADDLVAGFDGKRVRLQGQLIYRDDGTMVEVVPGSIVARSIVAGSIVPGSIMPGEMTPPAQEATRDLGAVTVTGEIVDSKCYLGVMNPGRGKVHRDCAARCVSGGIPPIFITADGARQYLLVDPDGNALGHDSLREFMAEPITIQAELLQRGDSRFLEVDPKHLRHTPDGLHPLLKRSSL